MVCRKTWHDTHVYLSITRVGSSAQRGAFLSIKSSLLGSFSRTPCMFGNVGWKKTSLQTAFRTCFQRGKKPAQWASCLSSPNIWLAESSKYRMHLSICAVTQTVKWLHVAAGQQPTLRKWSSLEGIFFNIKFLQFQGDKGIIFSSGFSTYGWCKL